MAQQVPLAVTVEPVTPVDKNRDLPHARDNNAAGLCQIIIDKRG